MANIVAQMQVLISAVTRGMTGPLSDAQKSLLGLQGVVSKTNTLLKSFGVGFGLFQVTQAVGHAVGVLKDFDSQMAVVKAVTSATSEEFNALRKNAIDLGQSTKFTATEIGGLQENLAKLGFTTPEILAATKGITALAVATGEDLGKSADVVGSTIRSFGLAATDTGRVVDVMAESFNRTALGLENFTEAIKYVAPIAAQAGLSIEETTALLGTLADSGIRGSQAGTSLRKIITDLGTESGDLSERLRKLAARGLTGADAMSEVGRTAYASLLILAKNADKTDQLTIGLTNVAGAAEKTAAIVGDTLAGDIDKLSSAYDSLILSGNNVSGALREITQAGTGLLNNLSEQDSALGKFLDWFGQLVTVIPRAAIQVANFFGGETLSVQELNAELTNLKRHRDAAIQSGNVAAERSLTLEIIKLTNEYKLLNPAVEAANKVITENATAVTALGAALVPAVGLIQGIEDKLKSLEEKKKASFNVSEIQGFNKEIENLRFQLELLNSTRSLSGFGKSIIDKEATEFQIPKIAVPEGLDALSQTGLASEEEMQALADFHMATLLKVTEARQAAGVAAIESTDQIILSQQQLIEKEQQVAEMAQRVGTIFGDTVGDVLSGQKTLLQGIKSITAKLLPILLAQALAGTIAGAGKTTAPPPVIVALAAAGVAAISAIFSKATGHSGGGVGGGGIGSAKQITSATARPTESFGESIQFEGKFRLEGPDMVAVIGTNGRVNGRLGG